MQIYEIISDHQAGMRLPLYAVTLAAPAYAGAPVLLIMHWHAFRRETPLRLSGATPPSRAVPGSAVELPVPWRGIEDLDRVLLDAAWRLGAWDLERSGHGPWWRLGAGEGEALAGRRAFGDYPDATADAPAPVLDAPSQADLLQLSARRGYVRWLFRPRSGGIWDELPADDATLADGGGRQAPCPVAPHAYDAGKPGRWVYRLGRGDGFCLP
ncbi:diguanylate cyclase [Achromobacter sp. Marseille-Q4962]|uniref:diguanylate cyclase n=1 Tax=Achromobacter sp. Marseille-Q4962 TaxID=2942202 RepID=UPI00207355CF|nr:diguanylate cyclase [Achromobacter sp. Marseille-Q4962]